MWQYILKGHEAVPEPDLLTWARWLEENQESLVADETVGAIRISTVFLGLDHNIFGRDRPALFQTMTFGGPDQYEVCERYSTWEEAEAGHKRIVDKAREAALS